MGVAPRIPGSGTSKRSTKMTNLIPAMSSNSQNGYIVSVKAQSGTNPVVGQAYNLFNGNYHSYNYGQSSENFVHFGSLQNGQIDIELPEAMEVHGAIVIGPNYESYGVQGPASAELYYSDNGTSYEKMEGCANIRNNAYGQLPMLDTSITACLRAAKHRYYRVEVYREKEYVGVNAVILF